MPEWSQDCRFMYRPAPTNTHSWRVLPTACRGYTVCHVAAQYGQTATLYHLALKWGADTDALDADGRSPLHWAAYKGFAGGGVGLIGGEEEGGQGDPSLPCRRRNDTQLQTCAAWCCWLHPKRRLAALLINQVQPCHNKPEGSAARAALPSVHSCADAARQLLSLPA